MVIYMARKTKRNRNKKIGGNPNGTYYIKNPKFTKKNNQIYIENPVIGVIMDNNKFKLVSQINIDNNNINNNFGAESDIDSNDTYIMVKPGIQNNKFVNSNAEFGIRKNGILTPYPKIEIDNKLKLIEKSAQNQTGTNPIGNQANQNQTVTNQIGNQSGNQIQTVTNPTETETVTEPNATETETQNNKWNKIYKPMDTCPYDIKTTINQLNKQINTRNTDIIYYLIKRIPNDTDSVDDSVNHLIKSLTSMDIRNDKYLPEKIKQINNKIKNIFERIQNINKLIKYFSIPYVVNPETQINDLNQKIQTRNQNIQTCNQNIQTFYDSIKTNYTNITLPPEVFIVKINTTNDTVDINNEDIQKIVAYANYIYAVNNDKAFILKKSLVKYFSLPFTGKLNTSQFEECVKRMDTDTKNKYFDVLIQCAVMIPEIDTQINTNFMKTVLDEFIRLLFHLKNVGLLNDAEKIKQLTNIIKYLKSTDITNSKLDINSLLNSLNPSGNNGDNGNNFKQAFKEIITTLKTIKPAPPPYSIPRGGPNQHDGVGSILNILSLLGS